MNNQRPVANPPAYHIGTRPPPTSAQLLARIVPFRGSGLGRRYPRYQPQVISIYRDRVR